jgi:hypothetical protein
MQKFLFLFLLFLCAASTNTTAQIKKTNEAQETFKVLPINNPELKKYFLNNSLSPTVWGTGFYQGQQRHAMRDLTKIIKVSPMAMAEYRAYQDLNTAKNILNVASIACLVGAMGLLSNATNSTDFRPIGLLYTGGLVCSIISIPVSIGAKGRLNQTLRNYNADLIGNFKNE